MDGSSHHTGFDMRAVGAGAMWGLVALLAGSVIQGIIGYSTPLSAAVESIMGMVWQAMGALVGGFLAGRRSAGSGWLHGAMAGLSLILAVAAVMGVSSALPTLAIFLKMAGVGTGAGALAGILGVNTRR